MTINNIDRNMVLDALGEFDRIGRDAMLEKYSSGPRGKSIKWFIHHDGKYYDQKLILRAAHVMAGLGHLPPGRGTFKANEARRHLNHNFSLRLLKTDRNTGINHGLWN